MKAKLIYFTLFLTTVSFAVVAQNNVNNTHEDSIQVQNNGLNNSKEWNLTPDEYLKYQNLMKGKSGLWYQQLTPASVLGLNADNPQDQKHFAELVAKEEHDRLANELKFDNLVHDALLRLYPQEPIIKAFDMSAYNPITTRLSSRHG